MLFRSSLLLLVVAVTAAIVPPPPADQLFATKPSDASIQASVQGEKTLGDLYSSIPFDDQQKIELFDAWYTMKGIMMETG